MKELIPLKGVVQDYDWGMDENSLVSKLSSDSAGLDKFAELWVGSHPKSPAQATVANGETVGLDKLLVTDSESILGPAVSERFGRSLPFLFKILSVGSALSIQAHPNESHAKELHAQELARQGEVGPEYQLKYPDPFPKPEVGIALSTVELLYGFRTRDSIISFLDSSSELFVPEFAALVGEQVVKTIADDSVPYSEALEGLYRAIFSADEQSLKQSCEQLLDRLRNKEALSDEEQWLLTLEEKYPQGDVGFFSFFVLNLVKVPESKALFIGPNIAHAYLKNELAECMAPSDNVVRAGLTSKFIDVATLLDMLEYKEQPPELVSCTPVGDGYSEYAVPSNGYFKVGLFSDSTSVTTDGHVELLFSVNASGSISSASAKFEVKPGTAILVPATLEGYQVELESGSLFRVRPDI